MATEPSDEVPHAEGDTDLAHVTIDDWITAPQHPDGTEEEASDSSAEEAAAVVVDDGGDAARKDPDVVRPAPPPRSGPRKAKRRTGRGILRNVPRRARVAITGGTRLHLLVLSCTDEDTTAVDLSSGALLRLRVPWPETHGPDLALFDVVEATLAADPERDDLAQPEAASADGLPRHVGTLRGRKVRHLLERLAAPPDGPLLGFTGPAAPYWEFRGACPSTALIEPTRPPQLIRRPSDNSTWVRFGWERDDVWLPVEDRGAARALDAARRDRLSGKSLASALGFSPQYLLIALSRPRDGHCYKVCSAILPSS